MIIRANFQRKELISVLFLFKVTLFGAQIINAVRKIIKLGERYPLSKVNADTHRKFKAILVSTPMNNEQKIISLMSEVLC